MSRQTADASGQMNVLVLDKDGDLADGIRDVSDGLDVTISHAADTQQLGHLAPHAQVLVAGPQHLTAAGLRRIALVHQHFPQMVVVLAPNGKPVPLEEAVNCGVAEVLPWPSPIAKVRATLEKALRKVSQGEPSAKLGHVFTITSATGGCGKTFYATNLAGYLAKATGKRVCLVDLDLQFGEVAIALRIKAQHTVADLLEASLEDLVVHHEAGYDVLCAPPDPVTAERVGPVEATQALEAARASYDYVVVDTPPSLNEVVLSAFDLSGSLIVLATMDVPSLKNMQVFLQTLDRLKVPSHGVSLVLNKAEEGTGLELHQIEKLYAQGFMSVLPYAREVSRSINLGMPVIFSSPGSEVSKRLIDGAQSLVAPNQPWKHATPERTRARRRWWPLRKGTDK